MKITLIIPTLKQGGAERVMSELANTYSNSNHKVHIILLVKEKHFYNINKNVTIHNLGFTKKNNFYKLLNEIKTLFKLRRIIKEINPDFVLSFMTKYNILTIISTMFLKQNIYISDRSNPKKELSSFLTYGRKFFYRYSNGIIAQTSLAKEILYKQTKHKNIKVIFNPLKEININPTIKKEKIILSVGRLVPEKGHIYLIEAFNKIENKENWRVEILGEGPLKEEIENKISDYNLEEYIKLRGSISNIDEWLNKSSIFVFPSISEGFPNALVEAMSAGLAVISFDCDAGPRDIINKDNGILIESRNTELLSEKINFLMKNEIEREKLSVEAKKISKIFNRNKISEKFLDFCKGEKN